MEKKVRVPISTTKDKRLERKKERKKERVRNYCRVQHV
jgi:hypothetical protein